MLFNGFKNQSNHGFVFASTMLGKKLIREECFSAFAEPHLVDKDEEMEGKVFNNRHASRTKWEATEAAALVKLVQDFRLRF